MTTNAYTYLTPLKEEINKCIKCGVCMTGCPTFAVTRDESMVARGRIMLVGAALNGRLEVSGRLEEAIGSCIGCLTCDVNCPSGVRIGEIICAAKAQIAETRGMNILERIASKGVVGLRWPLPLLARFASLLIRIYDQFPVDNPLGRLLPFVRGNIKRRFPPAGGQTLTSQYPKVIKTTVKKKRGSVAFFPGCVIDMSTQNIGRATISVLNKLGYDVIMPQGQYCCGSPLQSLGDRSTAIKVAMKNIDIFSHLEVEAIIVSCATCGHTLKKEYPLLLNHVLNGHFKKVQDFSDKIVDIHEFIYETHMPLRGTKDDENPPSLRERDRLALSEVEGVRVGLFSSETVMNLHSESRRRVTFHDPCHLKKGLGIWQQPRDILKSLPSVEFVEMNEPDACCGFGGIFSLYHYDLALKIGERKAGSIKQTGSEIVATGCPGCKIHIEDSLHRAGYDATVKHTVELLDEVL